MADPTQPAPTPLRTIQVVDPNTGDFVEAPEDQAQAGLAQGTFQLPEGNVHVLDPDGTVQQLDASDPENTEYLRALVAGNAGGARLASTQDILTAREQAKYDERNIAAGLAGAARGLTMGGSDLLAAGAEKLGLLPSGTSEDLLKLQQYNPNISAATEVGGNIATGILTGGATAAVGRGIGAALGSGAAGAIGGVAAAGAVESGVASAGMAAGREALRVVAEPDHEFNTEAVMTAGGEGALFGGAAAGALAGLVHAVKAVPGVVGKAAGMVVTREGREAARVAALKKAGVELTEAQADDAVRTAAKQVKYADDARKAASNARAQFGDEIGAVLDEVATPTGARAVFEPDNAVDDITRKFADAFDQREAATAEFTRTITGRKAAIVAQALPAEPPPGAVGAMAARLADAGRVLDIVKANPNLPLRGLSVTKKLAQITKNYEGLAQRIQAGADPRQVAAESYSLLDDMKRATDYLAVAAKKSGASAVFDEISQYSNQTRTLLEDASVWGDELAGKQTRINKAWTDYLTAIAPDDAKLYELSGTKTGFNEAYVTNKAYIRALMQDPTSVVNENAVGRLERTLNTQDTLLRTLVEEYGDEVPPQVRQWVTEQLDGNTRQIADSLTEARTGADLRGRLAAIEPVIAAAPQNEAVRALAASGGGALAGAVAGGPIGAVLGGVGGAVLRGRANAAVNPVAAMRAAYHGAGLRGRGWRSVVDAGAIAAEAAAQRVTRAIDDAARALAGTKPGPARAVRTVAAVSAARFAQTATAVRDNPASVPGPQADAVREYLMAQLPPSSAAGPLDRPGTIRQPGDYDARKWLLQHRYATNPVSVVEQLARQQVDPVGLAVVKQLYPAMYAKMLDSVTAAVRAAGTERARANATLAFPELAPTPPMGTNAPIPSRPVAADTERSGLQQYRGDERDRSTLVAQHVTGADAAAARLNGQR